MRKTCGEIYYTISKFITFTLWFSRTEGDIIGPEAIYEILYLGTLSLDKGYKLAYPLLVIDHCKIFCNIKIT